MTTKFEIKKESRNENKGSFTPWSQNKSRDMKLEESGMAQSVLIEDNPDSHRIKQIYG